MGRSQGTRRYGVGNAVLAASGAKLACADASIAFMTRTATAPINAATRPHLMAILRGFFGCSSSITTAHDHHGAARSPYGDCYVLAVRRNDLVRTFSGDPDQAFRCARPERCKA